MKYLFTGTLYDSSWDVFIDISIRKIIIFINGSDISFYHDMSYSNLIESDGNNYYHMVSHETKYKKMPYIDRRLFIDITDYRGYVSTLSGSNAYAYFHNIVIKSMLNELI